MINDFELSYREVIPDQTNTEIRKDITLNTGTLQFLGYVLNIFDANFLFSN